MLDQYWVDVSVRLRHTEQELDDVNRWLRQYQGYKLNSHQATEVRRLESQKVNLQEKIEGLVRELQNLYM